MPHKQKRAPRMISLTMALALAAVGCTVASANEVRYSYDALGRLITTEQTGAATGYLANYQYDAAGNRINRVISNSANGSATSMIVSRIGNSYFLIPIEKR